MIVKGNIQVSVIFLPSKDETYWAIKNVGAFCNNSRIEISRITTIDDSVIYAGDFSHTNNSVRQIQIKSVDYLSSRVSKIRMVGAACIDYSSVASGKADGLISITRNPWDIYPGLLLCQEAGAIITDLNGDVYKFGASGVIIASNKDLSQELIRSLKVN